MAIITRDEKGSALSYTEMDNNFTELETSPEGKFFTKDQNKGIIIDKDDPNFGWHDLVSNLYECDICLSPSRILYRGGIGGWQFDEGESLFIDFHLPHDYAMGTTIFIHAHWSHVSNVVIGGSVTWGFEMMYAKGHNQGAFDVPVVASVVSSASSTQYQHLIGEVSASSVGGSAVELDTDLLEVDGIIQCRVYLDSNDIITSDASVAKPFLHFVDIHYQSTGIPTKHKEPNFWG